jgi:hypothetical protein
MQCALDFMLSYDLQHEATNQREGYQFWTQIKLLLYKIRITMIYKNTLKSGWMGLQATMLFGSKENSKWQQKPLFPPFNVF